MSEKLKPCPFCDSHARVSRTWKGYNIQCNICGNGTIPFEKLECAIAAWNRRVNESEDN